VTDLASDTRTGSDTKTASETSLRELEQYRGELTGYCYRMLGSAFDADDAVQETMVRAWRSFDSFEGRSSLRGWVYRIATNVCLDALRSRQRRALPSTSHCRLGTDAARRPVAGADVDHADPGQRRRAAGGRPGGAGGLPGHDPAGVRRRPAAPPAAPAGRPDPARGAVLAGHRGGRAARHDVASVNSALQRARATLASSNLSDTKSEPVDEDDKDLLARYCAASSPTTSTVVTLLHEDARQSMPPLALWLEGRDEVRDWLLGHGSGCRGSKMLPMVANGMPAFAQYRWRPAGRLRAVGAAVIEISAGKIGPRALVPRHAHVPRRARLFAGSACPRTSTPTAPHRDDLAGRAGRQAPAPRRGRARAGRRGTGCPCRMGPRPGRPADGRAGARRAPPARARRRAAGRPGPPATCTVTAAAPTRTPRRHRATSGCVRRSAATDTPTASGAGRRRAGPSLSGMGGEPPAVVTLS
jgi:RNA polymerase sigma-70 factor (ECF subfamily)